MRMNREGKTISPTTTKVLEKYGCDPDSVIGFDRAESRPIYARELLCLECVPNEEDLTTIRLGRMRVITKYLYKRGE